MNEPIGGWVSLIINEIKIYETTEVELFLDYVHRSPRSQKLQPSEYPNSGKRTIPQHQI